MYKLIGLGTDKIACNDVKKTLKSEGLRCLIFNLVGKPSN